MERKHGVYSFFSTNLEVVTTAIDSIFLPYFISLTITLTNREEIHMKKISKLFLIALLFCCLTRMVHATSSDTMSLTDEPGNWFKSNNTGTSLSVINAGQEVNFKISNCCTNTRHTVTLLIKPEGSNLTLDQDHSITGTLSATFDVPGVYVFVCKVHPYMTGVVAVKDADGNIPDVTAGSLPFISYLGITSLPADTVLAVLRTVASTDAEKAAKWDIRTSADQVIPKVPGVGEIWIDTQFEHVNKQTDKRGTLKPGTITIVDAETFTVEREINGLGAKGMWNNPHNMWADFTLDTIYNTNWFGEWINKIDRQTGRIIQSITVGEAPTHIVTIPTLGSSERGVLTIPLSAENNFVKVEDGSDGLKVIDSKPTGDGRNHPHGHWLNCGRGDRMVVPNVFKGVGVAGSISILDSLTGDVLKEFDHDSNDPLRSVLLMPIAAGECHVNGISKAYVANAVSGYITVIDVDGMQIRKNIPVTVTPDGQTGKDLLNTLQVPIQTPVSPDGKFVAAAILSLTAVPNAKTNSTDYVVIIDALTDEVVAYVPTPGGTHGINWGAKLGGGYYAYVSSQFANVLAVIDIDPNGDGKGSDAAVVGTILLANGSNGAGVTDGTGGQGIKPLPMVHDGWIQPTVELAGTGILSAEVEDWIIQLTPEQKDPEGHEQ